MTLFSIAFVLICMTWPLVGIGLLFWVDGRLAREMVMLLPDLFRALLGLPYDPRPEAQPPAWIDQAVGAGFILAGGLVAASFFGII